MVRTPINYLLGRCFSSFFGAELVRGVSDPYTIVLWCADTARFASMVASHLLSEGLLVANHGRIDDDIPVAIGVANARRWPIFSREVSAKGVIRSRTPRVSTPQRHDYLLTITSGQDVDSAGAPPQIRGSRVISISELVAALELVSPSQLSRDQIITLFDEVARAPKPGRTHDGVGANNVHSIADVCQRLISALAR